MKRWAFNIAAASSLMLCAAVCVLWALSHSQSGSTWQSSQGGTTRFAIMTAGRLQLARQAAAPERSGDWEADTSQFGDVTLMARDMNAFYPVFANNPQPSTRIFGFEWADRRMTFSKAPGRLPTSIVVTQRSLAFPLWPPALVLLLTPCAWLIAAFHRRRRRLRLQSGRCPHCNYDLRGGHDRCPECGQSPR